MIHAKSLRQPISVSASSDGEQPFPDRDRVGRRSLGHEVRVSLALGARFVAVAEIETVGPFAGVADEAPPRQSQQAEILFRIQQRHVLEVRRGEHVVDVPCVGFGGDDGEHLDAVAVVYLGDGLQDEVGKLGLADVFLVDQVEDAAKVEAARGQEQCRVVVEPARAVVAEFDAGNVDAQACIRRRAAADDIEL